MSKQNLNLTFLIHANRPFAAVLLIGSAVLIGAGVGGVVFTLAAYLLASIGDTFVSTAYMVDQMVLQKFVLFEIGAMVGAFIAMGLLVLYWNRIWAGFLAEGE